MTAVVIIGDQATGSSRLNLYNKVNQLTHSTPQKTENW